MCWKANWKQTRQHFLDWWSRDGLVLGMWGHGFPQPQPVHENCDLPPKTNDLEKYHSDPQYVTQKWHARMAHCLFPADSLPIIRPSIGTVELAAYLGADVTFQEETLWYGHIPSRDAIVLDPNNKWYHRMCETLRRTVQTANGNYAVGMPGISPGLDVLAELHGTQELMMDMLDRPEWVKARLDEIDAVYFEVFDKFREIIRQPDGSMAYYPFMIWGPGRVSVLQCDAAAMISEDLFHEFVVPSVRRCCDWLDHSLFHVDGPGMLKHVDALCEIESLDAIQFTPGPNVPRGADPHWHSLYKRVLAAGKCVQATWMSPADVIPLLDAIGTKGVYVQVECQNAHEMETLAQEVAKLHSK